MLNTSSRLGVEAIFVDGVRIQRMSRISNCENPEGEVRRRIRKWRVSEHAAWVTMLAGITMTTGCASLQSQTSVTPAATVVSESREQVVGAPEEGAQAEAGDDKAGLAGDDTGRGERTQASYPGTERFIRKRNVHDGVNVRDTKLTLNFQDADLRDVVHVILGETLNVTYIYDPRINGSVNLQTTNAVRTESVLSILETILRMNGAAMVIKDDLYHIVPASEAIRGNVVPQIGSSSRALTPGYSVRVVPLEYISATQMQEILDPMAPPQSIVRIDLDRNLLLLAGTSRELELLLETVEIFDVDWLEGMSFGVFSLINVSAKTIVQELDTIFGDPSTGPLAGVVRFVVMERLNAILVVTPREHYLRQIETWIERLDRGAAVGQNLYVYRIANGKATEIASILSQIFEHRRSGDEALPGRVGPGHESVELVGRSASAQGAVEGEAAGGRQTLTLQQGNEGQAQTRAATLRTTQEAVAITEGADVRIIADEVNNSLVILASAQEYQMVEAAVRKLDVVPLQVLVEATIVEVTLNDSLRYGVQWFLRTSGYRGGGGQITLGDPANAAANAAGTGLSYIISDIAGVTRLALEALENVTEVRVISSPHLMIQDNQTAVLQIGDEVPVVTRQQQSPLVDANVVNTVEFRETGVILRVTPRVNASGSISMDVEQEFSEVVPNPSNELTPTISQRKFKSTVVVHSGETLILGGLMEMTDSTKNIGVPILSRVPILSALFGTRESTGQRTELMVLISPRVVRNLDEARKITDEMRRRMRDLPRSQGWEPLRSEMSR